MGRKIKVSEFSKRRSESDTYKDWREEKLLSRISSDSMYATSSKSKKQSILDDPELQTSYYQKGARSYIPIR